MTETSFYQKHTNAAQNINGIIKSYSPNTEIWMSEGAAVLEYFFNNNLVEKKVLLIDLYHHYIILMN